MNCDDCPQLFSGNCDCPEQISAFREFYSQAREMQRIEEYWGVSPIFQSPKIPKSTEASIREYLKARRIWETFRGRYVLNDEYTLQIRRDTQKFRIERRFRLGR